MRLFDIMQKGVEPLIYAKTNFSLEKSLNNKPHYTILFIVMLFLSFGCEKKVDLGVHEVHWDRDMCIRCKMVVSERRYAAQTTNPKTGKTYYFDDIGCLIMWFEEEKVDWVNSAKIWVTDKNSGKWIDAKKAMYSTEDVTPMGFGFAAFKVGTEPKDVEIIPYEKVVKRVIAMEKIKKGVNR